MPARRGLALALLLLAPAGCSLAGRTLGGYVDDALVKHAVKRRLTSDGVPRQGVKLDTFGGTVYLSGVIDTPEQKSEAEIAAWQVQGVEQVVNDLEQGRAGGPDLAYDAGGRVVATIYVVSWRDLVDTGLSTLAASGRPIDHVSCRPTRCSSGPIAQAPHYAVVLWHVSERDAATRR